jgi:hypothetical protein
MRRPFKAVTASLAIFASTTLLLVWASPLSASSALGFSLSPSTLQMSSPAGTSAFANVTLTNTKGPLVIQGPATVHNDQTNPDGIHVIFSDTQAGSCWQAYESLGNRIPRNTTCTFQVGFLPPSQGTFTGTLTVTRCTEWHVDPTFGFIVCDETSGSQTINLVGIGT